MGLFGNKKDRVHSTSRSNKKTKTEEEFKHSGLHASAKIVMKLARKLMGQPGVPACHPDLRVTMKNFRAGRMGVEPLASILKQRMLVILGDEQLEALFSAFEGLSGGDEAKAEYGGLTQASEPWQIAAAWRFLGEMFVMHWVQLQGATQANLAMADMDALYQAVTAADATVALQLWDGKAFSNGSPSPVTCLVRTAALKASPMASGPSRVTTSSTYVGPTRTQFQATRAGGGGGGRGGGGRGGGGRGGGPQPCHYCKNFLGVNDVTHTIDTCAGWLAKKK